MLLIRFILIVIVHELSGCICFVMDNPVAIYWAWLLDCAGFYVIPTLVFVLLFRLLRCITETSPCAIGNFRKWLLYKRFMSVSLIVIQTNIKFLKITVTWANIW